VVMHSPSTSDNNKYAQLTFSFIVLVYLFAWYRLWSD
jgi:hypothetical protein